MKLSSKYKRLKRPKENAKKLNKLILIIEKRLWKWKVKKWKRYCYPNTLLPWNSTQSQSKIAENCHYIINKNSRLFCSFFYVSLTWNKRFYNYSLFCDPEFLQLCLFEKKTLQFHGNLVKRKNRDSSSMFGILWSDKSLNNLTLFH